jgi:hypothetical protein
MLCATLVFAGPIFAQTSQPKEPSPSPVADVYVQTHSGIDVFTTNSSGYLTRTQTDAAVSGQLGAISGTHLVSIGLDNLHTYKINSNGTIGSSTAETNSQYFPGSECGNNTGSTASFDHTGEYFYLQLNNYDGCIAMQTYKLASSGALEFRGNVDWGVDSPSTNVTTASNDALSYGVFQQGGQSNEFAAYKRTGAGYLGANPDFYAEMPTGYEDGEGWTYYPELVSADPYGDLAAVVYEEDEYGDWDGYYRIASFAIESDGAIYSNQNYYNMPYLYNGSPTVMNASPSGVLMAVGGTSGLAVYHFDQAQPMGTYIEDLLPGIQIDQLAWDKSNHLYALSYEADSGYGALYVFTITPNNDTQTETLYFYPQIVYGNTGLVVVPK